MTETNTGKLCLTKAGRYLCLFAVVMLLGGTLALRGQDLGSISGTVTDPSGAAVPGAAITVKNSKTGTVVRTTATNQDGNYTVPALPASTYSLKAERSGFTSAIQSDVILSVHSSIRVDFQLKLGAVNQQVTVTAPAVHLQTETGTVSQSLSARHVEAIDTNGRNFEELAMLVPGAAAVTGMGMSMVGGFNNQVGSLANGSISFNGEEADHTLYTIDGLEDADRGGGGGSVFIPNQDAIGEMKVLTSNMGVDVGFATGGQIQVELKSGTDQFHGEAFEFNRNTAFDASTFFANASNTPKPQFNFNDFGFNIGGPVWIPGHAKKTFFFYSQDFRRLITGAGININGVPTAWTTGDLSSSPTVILNHNAPGTPCQIPGSTTMTTCYQPFANNQIAAIDPNAAILAKPGFLFEPPNTGTRYIASKSVPTTTSEEIARVDHQFSDKTSLMVHYLH
ncbi:MAG TPA: carboxypeptidase-like regulatory domain-containing protein, partial [Terriglobia bacterium]|nr:carboxypeptidase-like regulatory domain-containing protein [Terriglobia bacterium]